ncbi:MAG TPA: tRNA pseudouridine(54/55) synthase Pus10 [Nitrososphaerales archaeon]|nr:tRNA pseudouridine(54/55) synthase Pus10 [Nitrososphaerales archaeon]
MANEKLCASCLERQGVGKRESKKLGVVSLSCSLCHGSSGQLEQISKSAVNALSGFEFETFLVGTSFPQTVLDREDEIRALYKIRGRESIKSQTTRTISRRIRRSLEKKMEYSRPDITVLASLLDGSITVTSRSIWLSACYTKAERGIPQRSSICRTCNGVGCMACNYKGITSRSIESIISSYLKKLYNSEDCNFIWIGSEDSMSLVFGNGRPIFVEVHGPKRRNLKIGGSRAKTDLGAIGLRNIELLSSRPKSIPQLKMECLVHLIRDPSTKSLVKPDFNEIEKFKEVTVQVHLSSKYRMVTRKVYAISVEDHSENRFDLRIICDGGIPVKKLVSGEEGTVLPNISNSVNGFTIDQSQPFDVINLEISPPENALRYRGNKEVYHRRREGAEKMSDEGVPETDFPE